jgi:hypothetical protein
MSTDRETTSSEHLPDSWTALDELFFTLVGDVLSTNFLWGAAALLASYDPDEVPAVPSVPRQNGPSTSLPSQRSLAA